MKLVLCVALGLVTPGFCVGQASSPSEQSLQAILSELRSIHADMEQRPHAVRACNFCLPNYRYSQRLWRGQCNGSTQRDRGRVRCRKASGVSANLTRAEEAQNTTATEADKNKVASEINRLKDGLASMKRLEQIECQFTRGRNHASKGPRSIRRHRRSTECSYENPAHVSGSWQ